MLHAEDEVIRKQLLEGSFGLEKESLRVLGDGTLAHTAHPFPEDPHIVKDFSECQTEINTGVHRSVSGALKELEEHNRKIYARLQSLPEREYLWPFSNPPYIRNEEDIPIAVYQGNQVSKELYRNYLSGKYGRYKMTFSGIHVNYSFSEELLRAEYERHGGAASWREYKDTLYLELAQGLAECGWILVAVTAASPVLDGSFVEKGAYDQDVFTGMASVRCSEMGYWNEFPPVFDYTNVQTYADSMESYVRKGLLSAPSELYYPIRLKPAGENSLVHLKKNGISHIELRMFDLNPLAPAGVEEKDILFAQLLIVWIACSGQRLLSEKDQVKAVRNFKSAARYDLKTVKIATPECEDYFVADEAAKIIESMREFYHSIDADADAILDFEYRKFTDQKNRYAWKVKERYGTGFVKKGLELARIRQEGRL